MSGHLLLPFLRHFYEKISFALCVKNFILGLNFGENNIIIKTGNIIFKYFLSLFFIFKFVYILKLSFKFKIILRM